MNSLHLLSARDLLQDSAPADNLVGEPASAAPWVDDMAAVRVDRAQSELKHGRAVVIAEAAAEPASGASSLVATGALPTFLLATAVETLTATRLRWLLAFGAEPRLLITPERAQALGLAHNELPLALPLAKPQGVDVETLQRLAAVIPGTARLGALRRMPPAESGDPRMSAAFILAKRARLTPALLVVELPAMALAATDAAQVLRVSPADARTVADAARVSLRRVSDAHVPIAAHEDCTLVLFREINDDAEHVAIIVGQPDLSRPVPVRLHSSCLTGDLLGSLRCDCGDQLQRAIDHLAEEGGVLLYLSQEGRGTGLANKLRAYRLQDTGLDTIDADRYLGFNADERNFQAAVAMLQSLGIDRVQLLTNNPHKIDALRRGGIDVVNRVALIATVNPHNERYIRTKHERAGHLAKGSEQD